MLDKNLLRKSAAVGHHTESVAVIGLGRFGTAVARSLVQLGHEVLAVDARNDVVQMLADELPNVVQADCTDPEVLRQLGLSDFAHVVVAIGQEMESSVLIVLNLTQIGIKDIWCKANSASHGRIVERLGAHHVIFPEADMGQRVAHLVTGKMIDFIQFDDGFAIAKTRSPRAIHGKTLAQCELRKRHGVTVVGVKRRTLDFIYAQPETPIEEGDLLIVAGKTDAVEAFAANT